MKHYSLLLALITAALICSSLCAQEKANLQPNATVLSILQGNAVMDDAVGHFRDFASRFFSGFQV